MPARERTCPRCGEKMATVGFALLPSLSEAALAPEDCERSLVSLGLEEHDVIMVKGDVVADINLLQNPEHIIKDGVQYK